MGPITEEQVAMERHRPGGGVDTQGSVACGTKPVLGIGGQRQSSDIQEQCQEELASVQYSGRKRLYKLIRGVREETYG